MLWIVSMGGVDAAQSQPTVWCELPHATGHHLVVALRSPLEERPPRAASDVAALFVAAAGEPVGLVLEPGRYWLYARPARGPMSAIKALETAVVALKDHRKAWVTFGELPQTVWESPLVRPSAPRLPRATSPRAHAA